jgi:hypothetical protein
VTGTCKKCHARIRIPINGQTIENLKEVLAQTRGYECPGQHVELSTMLDDYTWDWTPVEIPDPPTDEDYGRKLITEHGRENVYYMGDDAIGTALDIPRLQTLHDLEHMGFGDFANTEHYYARHDSPRPTTRCYIKADR